MPSAQVERLLRDIERDRVRPERYSRNPFTDRLVLAVLTALVTTVIALARGTLGDDAHRQHRSLPQH